jgi:hypothetical protein
LSSVDQTTTTYAWLDRHSAMEGKEKGFTEKRKEKKDLQNE